MKFNRGSVSGFRKNSWGNLTYAELITRAIESSAEQRLTMPEIYAWIVQYVPYFKEKHDRKSTAGLKVFRLLVFVRLIIEIFAVN